VDALRHYNFMLFKQFAKLGRWCKIGVMKPRNTTATDPRLKKGHAHKSKNDYDRKKEKKVATHELEKERKR
jgi:hypothetical protein